MCNFLSFLILIRHKAFKNSFGYLAAYESLSNAFVLLIFLLWSTPWTLLSGLILLSYPFRKIQSHVEGLIFTDRKLVFLLIVRASFHCIFSHYEIGISPINAQSCSVSTEI
ncbi:hypothetical protein OSTOST_22326 [Ostertagia ostertagi]